MHRRIEAGSALLLLAASSAPTIAGCGGGSLEVVSATGGAAPSAVTASKRYDTWLVRGSRLLPDREASEGSIGVDEGGEAILADRMRILERPDGSVERASQLLPMGRVVALALPSRLGGGYVFSAVGGAGTQIWRASSWLGELSPLVSLSAVADDQRPVVAGFDRLYVRIKSGNKIVAIDAESGASLALGPLPAAPSFGEMIFVDGWRAVVDADLRGPLATFDAGATWKSIDYGGRIHEMAVEDGRAVLYVDDGRLELDARGTLTMRRDPPGTDAPEEGELARSAGPLGRRPLRTVVEDGWPDSPTTAVVARQGMLARVSLVDGRVIDKKPDAYPEGMPACHAIRLGPTFGFVCAEPQGGTALYRFDPPLSMTPVMEFDEPRFVAPSGNGAVVIRGACADDVTPTAGARAYCVLGVNGETREIRVRGDLGAERVVALSDGRVAVVVPPRPGASGQLSIIEGTSAKHLPLVLPDEPAASAGEVRRGLWLEGFEERRAGVIGGWIEAGGPILGIEVDVRGKVKAGEPRDAAGAVVAGRFGLFLGEEGQAFETTDGGMTFREFELPATSLDPRTARTRACGPAGCVVSGWIRTGWGKSATRADLDDAPDPEPLYLRSNRPATALSLRCSVVAGPTRPATPAPAAPPTARFATPPGEGFGGQWLSFRGIEPPVLDKDEIGVDAGAPFELVPMRAYVWGRRGADWKRAGRFMVRFEDRFDLGGGQHKTALTASPWADEETAAEAIGAPPRHNANWTAFLDPSGDAVLLSTCRGRGCALFSAVEGQPIVSIHDRAGSEELVRPVVQGVVRSGDSWFFLAPDESADRIGLWRVDLGVARPLRMLLRPARPRFAVVGSPRLVRRALGGGLGLLTEVAPDSQDGAGNFYVFPLDPTTGAVGEPIALGSADLGSRRLDSCRGSQDGWLVELSIEKPEPRVEISLHHDSGPLGVELLEARLRMDPGSICAEGFAARVDTSLDALSAGGKAPAKGGALALAVTESASGARAHLACTQDLAAKAPAPAPAPAPPP